MAGQMIAFKPKLYYFDQIVRVPLLKKLICIHAGAQRSRGGCEECRYRGKNREKINGGAKMTVQERG